MEPILQRYFNTFKKSFDITINAESEEETRRKDSSAFEKFINYTMFSLDYPGIFTSNIDLLDFTCVGGQYDTGIDGIGIRINEKLVRNIDEVIQIVERSKKIEVDFVFIQSKMRPNFDASEFNSFGVGVNNFLSEPTLPENEKIREFRVIKEFIYSDERVIEKLDANPSLYVYYIALGIVPEDEHFTGTKKLIEKNLSTTGCYFSSVKIELLGSKEILNFCKELNNQYSKQINIIDIFPLIVETKDDKVKKSYAFTCKASEFIKLLSKDDGNLRRSLFNDNVRDYLDKSAVNKEIEKTIVDNPEMFLLCNNGITIVCSDFEQVKDKLVKIENPQIVNGCQTSNSIFKFKDHVNINNVQILIRLISTENIEVSNIIVRGTNKQNQVLDEAFEATLPFHREILEPFFQSIDSDIKIYYERRIKQFNFDPLIRKTQIVNLRILTKSFVGMFLETPEKSGKHEAKLLEENAGKENRKIYLEEHSPYPYFIAALTWYMFEKYFREGKIDKRYKPFSEHLYLIFKYSIGQYPSSLVNGRKNESYYKKLLEALKEPAFGNQINKILEVFELSKSSWIKRGKSEFGIKDVRDFTILLLEHCRKSFIGAQIIKPEIIQNAPKRYEGEIISVRINRGVWFGFIKRGYFDENAYFDSRGYDGNMSNLYVGQSVSFELIDHHGKARATRVQLTK